jgi:uncharacterized protein (TIGR03435 family)
VNRSHAIAIVIASGALMVFAAFAQTPASAQTPGPPPTFDVASIRPSATPQGKGLPSLREDINTSPDTLTMRNVTLTTAIRYAYKLSVYEISGTAGLTDARYDIVAKAAAPAAAPIPEDQLRLMLQALLAERFKLAFHRQAQDISGYALVVGKNGPKLTAAAEGGGEGTMTGAALVFEGHKMPLSRLADIVSGALRVPVIDQTGLPGFYDFKLDLRPYVTARQPGDPPLVNRDTPGMQDALVDVAISALQDELGLRLEQRKVRLDVLVVDHAEKTPTEN